MQLTFYSSHLKNNQYSGISVCLLTSFMDSFTHPLTHSFICSFIHEFYIGHITSCLLEALAGGRGRAGTWGWQSLQLRLDIAFFWFLGGSSQPDFSY